MVFIDFYGILNRFYRFLLVFDQILLNFVRILPRTWFFEAAGLENAPGTKILAPQVNFRPRGR